MRKILLFTLILFIGNNFGLFGQVKGRLPAGTLSDSRNTVIEQKGETPKRATISVLPGGGGTSGNARAPLGNFRYERSVYLITATELATAGFPVGPVDLIGFSYSTAQTIATTGTLKIYLMNTAATTFGLTQTAWSDTATATSLIYGMTLASNASVTIPAATSLDVPFSGGSPFNYTGGGLYVAFEYSNPANTLSTLGVVSCNTSLTNGFKGGQGNTSLAAIAFGASSFRPATRLGTSLNDVVEVTQIYALGQIPIPFGNPDVIKALVTNKSAAPITFDVNFSVFKASDGTSRYRATQTVTALAAGASTTLTVSDYTATVIERDSIHISVAVQAGETQTTNNIRSVVQDVTSNTYSYNQGSVASGGVGFTGATGDFVARFTTNSSNSINQIDWNFSTGGQPFQIGIWDATGAGGTPGTNLWTSAAGTSVAGVSTILVSPPIAVNGDFFVGVRQTGTTNVSFSYQTETPIRSATFYYTSPSGGTAWTDFAPNNGFRFMIAPKFALNNDVGVTAIGQSGTTYIADGATSLAMTGTVANFGQVAASFDVIRTIKDATSTVIYTNTQSVASLAASASASVTFTDFTGFTSGSVYSITDTTIFSGDQNSVNNALTRSFTPTFSKETLILYTDVPSKDSLVNRFAGAGLSTVYNLQEATAFSGTLRIWKNVYYLITADANWTAAIRDSLKAMLDLSTVSDKRSLFIFGNDLGYINNRFGHTGTTADSTFYEQYLHSRYVADDWKSIFATTKHIKGIMGYTAVNGDTVGGNWPDLITAVNGGTGVFIPITESGNGDSCIAVAYAGSYNSFYGTNVFAQYCSYGSATTQILFNTMRVGGDSLLPITIKCIPEGYYNTVTDRLSLLDTFWVCISHTTAPFATFDSARVVIDTVSFSGTASLSKVFSGTYYISIKNPTTVETWSKAGGESFTLKTPLTYDFTSAQTQAYGDNLSLLGTKYCLYSGDINQDGFIDNNDLLLIDNDAFNFEGGYRSTDLNGDLFVDNNDLLICDNNAFNFIGTANPHIFKKMAKRVISPVLKDNK